MKYFEISKILKCINHFRLKCVNFLGSESLKEVQVILLLSDDVL